jgi:hypothetical protein
MTNPKNLVLKVPILIIWSPLKVFWRFVSKYHEPIAVLVAIAATFVAMATVWLQNETSKELAKKQNFFQFYQQWESDGMQERRARLAATLLKNRKPEELDDSPLVFLETLSKATKDESTDYGLVWTTFYYDLTNYWAAAKEYADDLRAKENCKCFYEELEKMSERFINEPVSEHPKQSGTEEEQRNSVDRFLKWEMNRKLTPQDFTTEGGAKDGGSPFSSQRISPGPDK